MLCPYCRTENQPGSTRCAACTSWMVDPPPVREWTRATQGRMIAGVCRGLANRFGIPVAAVRLAFALSVLFGGWGLVVYAALWIAMPLPPLLPVRAAPAPTDAPGGAAAQ